MDLSRFFRPAAVAVVGARPEDGHVGAALMKNLIAGGTRTVYPVTDKYPEVFGIPAHPSIAAIGKPVDLAVIATRVDLVPQALRDAAAAGAAAAVVISAGFKEAGEEGKKLEEELRLVSQAAGIPFLGPNCLGVIDGNSGLNASFALGAPLAGAIGCISQSGAIGTAFIEWSRGEGVGISKFVSLGNEAGITEVEMLRYLGDDPDTRAILLYLEHVSDGPKLLSVAREIIGAGKKPVVLLRAGRSERGSAAAMSHTGSLAPEDAIFTAACRQAGIATVTTLRDLFNAAKLLSLGTNWSDKTRLAIVTNGGGPSVNAADLVELSESMELVSFDEGTTAALKNVLPPMAAVGNPIDVIGDAGSDRYKAALDILLPRAEIDAVMVIVTPQMMTDAKAIAQVVAAAGTKKPIIPVFLGGAVMEPGTRVLKEHRMVNFDFPSDAIAALDALTPKRKAAAGPVKRAGGKEMMLPFDETKSLLNAYGLSLEGEFVRLKEDLGSAMAKLGAEKFAMKAISRDVVHKTEARAVMLDIPNAKEAARAWDEIAENVGAVAPEAAIEGMLVQPMLVGKEVIVGMKRDPVFGPVVIFGLGGIFVELLHDVAMRIAPFSEDDAKEMLGEIAGAKYLGAWRNSLPADTRALSRILLAVGRLAMEHPEIKEIDLNPVIAAPDGAHIADARLLRAG